MSWFEYGTPVKRSHRKGVALRVRHLPDDILIKAKALMKEDEEIEMVFVKEIQKNNNVLLEFWCKERPYGMSGYRVWADSLKENPGLLHRYVVFYFSSKENPEWVCEGDIGRGYKE